MRFTCTLAAFLVAAAAAASIVGAAPLPDVGSGQAEVRARRAGDHCPRDFPFPTHGPAPLAGNICYNDADSAKKGTGLCGTWCTKDVNVGDGCGGNQDRICGDDEDRTSYPITYAYHLGSQSCSAGENHVISQYECIGDGTNPPGHQGTTSKVLDFLKSRGEVNRIDNYPIRHCGEVAGGNAEGCWSNGDSLFYVTGEPHPGPGPVTGKTCDAVEVHTQIGPVCAGIMRDGDKISLKSWRGDYLHRPDSAQGVTTRGSLVHQYNAAFAATGCCNVLDSGDITLKYWVDLPDENTFSDMFAYCEHARKKTGSTRQLTFCGCGNDTPAKCEQQTEFGKLSSDIGNEWTVEVLASGKISLKSWKGDYLHRPNSAQGVTTWSTGIGNEWTAEVLASGKISLKSWKGDSLHRPNSAQGVTTWSSGIGNEWTVELLTSPFKVVELFPRGSQSCSAGGAGVSHVTSKFDCIGDGTNSHQGTTSKMLDLFQSMGKANRIDNYPIRHCGEVAGGNAEGCWSNGDSLFYVTGEPHPTTGKTCDAVESHAQVGPVCFRDLAENADGGSTLIELEGDTVIDGREAVFIYEEVKTSTYDPVWVLLEENEAVELDGRARQRRGKGQAIRMKWPLRKKYLKLNTKIVVGKPDGHSNNYCKQRGCG